MIKHRMVLAAASVLALVGHSTAGTVTDEKPATHVFKNAKVYTVNEERPWAEAVAVRGNEIVFVGASADVEQFVGEGTSVHDLAGKMVLPGFVSAHDHLIASAWTNAGVQLYDAKDKADTLARIKVYAEKHPDHPVIKGIGWNQGVLGGLPTAEELDAAVPDRPALLLDYTIHDAWLNTAAMKKAKISKESKDVLPGVTYWVRDEEGNPIGVGIELQWMQAYMDLGAWDPVPMVRESAEALYPLAARNGTTTFLNPGVITPNIKDVHGGMERDFEAAVELLHEWEKAGTLKLRTVALPMFKNGEGDPQRFVDFGARMRERFDSDMLRVRSLKIHPEGNTQAGVAPFLQPYEGTDSRGEFNVAPEVTKAIVLAAAKKNLDVMIHTDGDRSSRAAVDAIVAAREAGFSDNRSALHHAIFVHPDDQKRIIEYRIPVNSTPNFSNDFGGQGAELTRLVGAERVRTSLGSYPHLARSGVPVSISADVPSSPQSMQAPLYVIAAATTLTDPRDPGSKPFPRSREPMSVEQAIRAMTIDAAWQLRMEDKIGSIETGKYADLVVLEKSPFDVPKREISEIEVSGTMMDGKFTHGGDF